MTDNEPKKVAIIIRTKDRPLLLQRALKSITSQTYTNYVVVIVNDGGDHDQLEAILTQHSFPQSASIQVINNDSSQGKWKAANQGIEGSKSEYIVLHDDDDSWTPTFLEETVRFLDTDSSTYGGVIGLSNIVREIVTEKDITITETTPFAREIQHISFYELCKHNLFPPIAYLYRRSIHDKIGLYNESMRVLGDWEFNLRTIQHFDIAIVHTHLANWHFRDETSTKDKRSLNVTHTNKLQYKEDVTLLMNSLLRKDLASGSLGVGYLVNTLYFKREEDEAAKADAARRFHELTGHIHEIRDYVLRLENGVAQGFSTLSAKQSSSTKKRFFR